jgi:hypothetical protein
MEKIKESPSVSFVTVTFTGDKWPMLLQAHSIEKFVKEPTTHYVIIEDQSGVKTRILEWLCLLQPIYKKHRLVLLDQSSAPELFLEWDKGIVGGWIQQQYIKLKMHELINTDYYLTLDSKNFFIRPTSLSEFYGKEGCDTIMPVDDVPQHPSLYYWVPWMELIEKHTKKSRPSEFWFAGTPFSLKTEIVKDFFNDYDIDSMFTEAMDTTHYNSDIDKHVRISEYILYAYFTDAVRDVDIQWCCGYGSGMSEELESLFNDRMNNKTKPVFTLHRDRLAAVQHRKEVIDYLVFCGLEPSYVIPAVMLDRKSQGHG